MPCSPIETELSPLPFCRPRALRRSDDRCISPAKKTPSRLIRLLGRKLPAPPMSSDTTLESSDFSVDKHGNKSSARHICLDVTETETDAYDEDEVYELVTDEDEISSVDKCVESIVTRAEQDHPLSSNKDKKSQQMSEIALRTRRE
jgi:hypothetical protein